MPQKPFSSTLLALVFSVLLFAACSPPQPAASPTSNLEEATATVSLPTHTPPPTAPPIPVSEAASVSEATPVSEAAPTAMETIEPEEGLDLVIFGDSTLWGVGEFYAVYIEEDLGVPVRLHDMWQGSMSAVTLLGKLEENEMARDAVREAEIVVYFANPVGSATGDWECIAQPYSVTDCSPKTFSGYRETLEAIVAEIFALREGESVVIRATDFYVPILSSWREAGVEEACTVCLENMNEAFHQAAMAWNVPVARVYDAFNGPEHDEDPRDKGYIGQDGIHTTDLGRMAIASLLRDLGYEPVSPNAR